VARVRRLAGTSRVGHTGTLDPFATGVLPLVIGRATRLARFFTAGRKTYVAEVRLGVATSTHDADGDVLSAAGTDRLPPPDVVEAALTGFRGRFEQRPPDFSAKKVQGIRAYELARQERPVDLRPVPVEVFDLALVRVEGDRVILSLECSPGFYVRALARDLGARLGCGAHLGALRRTRSGEFTDSQSVGLADLERDPAGVRSSLVPLARVLLFMPAAHLGPQSAARVGHGNAVPVADVERWEPGDESKRGIRLQPDSPERGIRLQPDLPGDTAGRAEPGAGADVRVFGPDGRLLAIARHDGRVLQPSVVLV
jgi:tRNA pseudouridine55 synthase